MYRLAQVVIVGALSLPSWGAFAQSAQAPRTYLALTTASTAAKACSDFAGTGLSCLALAPKQEKLIDSTGRLDVVSYALDCRGDSSPQLTGSLADWFRGRSVCGVVLLGTRHIDDGIDIPTLRFVIVHASPNHASASLMTADDGTLAALFGAAFKTRVSITQPNSDAAQLYAARLGSVKRQALLEKVQSLEFATQAQEDRLEYDSSQEAYRKTRAAYVDFCRHQIDTAQSLVDRYRQAWQTADIQDIALRRRAEEIVRKCRDQIDSQQQDVDHLASSR